mgnify:CR=1 FL=1
MNKVNEKNKKEFQRNKETIKALTKNCFGAKLSENN